MRDAAKLALQCVVPHSAGGQAHEEPRSQSERKFYFTARLAGRAHIKWEELGEYDYITLAQGSGNRFLIDQALARLASRPRWYCEVHHVPALVSLVQAGLGIGVVPRMALPPDNRGGLAAVPLEAPAITRTLGLISRRGRPLAPAAQLLYDMVTART
ncbi:LysR substrate-binding domain-containing protein [Cupriavidus sp. BIC8F]|uniref:LysR substrate-binding domain-containing protein n=1 Tax=Cupriavidus sp. BIC8F TaxID=3079014 RepID=UPI003966B2CF